LRSIRAKPLNSDRMFGSGTVATSASTTCGIDTAPGFTLACSQSWPRTRTDEPRSHARKA
jgi:hypothetical protein